MLFTHQTVVYTLLCHRSAEIEVSWLYDIECTYTDEDEDAGKLPEAVHDHTLVPFSISNLEKLAELIAERASKFDDANSLDTELRTWIRNNVPQGI